MEYINWIIVHEACDAPFYSIQLWHELCQEKFATVQERCNRGGQGSEKNSESY